MSNFGDNNSNNIYSKSRLSIIKNIFKRNITKKININDNNSKEKNNYSLSYENSRNKLKKRCYQCLTYYNLNNNNNNNNPINKKNTIMNKITKNISSIFTSDIFNLKTSREDNSLNMKIRLNSKEKRNNKKNNKHNKSSSQQRKKTDTLNKKKNNEIGVNVFKNENKSNYFLENNYIISQKKMIKTKLIKRLKKTGLNSKDNQNKKENNTDIQDSFNNKYNNQIFNTIYVKRTYAPRRNNNHINTSKIFNSNTKNTFNLIINNQYPINKKSSRIN